jgi:hypothetical protein
MTTRKRTSGSKRLPRSTAADRAILQMAELGISAAQLAQCQFSPKYSCPLDERPFTLDPTIPEHLWPKVFPLIRPILVLRITTSDSPNDASYLPEAWAEIAISEMEPLIEIANNVSRQQRDRARLPRKRNYIPFLKTTIAEMVANFCIARENRDLSIMELWRPFYAYLDASDLSPREMDGEYFYNIGDDKQRPISFSQFRRLVQLSRRAAR